MENSHNYRILKLKSGENIICSIKKDLKDKFIVEYPFDMETMVLVDRFGIPRQEKLILKKWIQYSKGNAITLPKDHIVGIMNPIDTVLRHYLQVKKNGGMVVQITPEEEQQIREMQEDARNHIQNMINDYFQGGIPEDMLEEIAENMSDDMFDEEVIEDDNDDEDDQIYGNRFSDWSPDPSDYT